MPNVRETASALTGYWMIPGQIAFFCLKNDIQNCCFVT